MEPHWFLFFHSSQGKGQCEKIREPTQVKYSQDKCKHSGDLGVPLHSSVCVHKLSLDSNSAPVFPSRERDRPVQNCTSNEHKQKMPAHNCDVDDRRNVRKVAVSHFGTPVIGAEPQSGEQSPRVQPDQCDQDSCVPVGEEPVIGEWVMNRDKAFNGDDKQGQQRHSRGTVTEHVAGETGVALRRQPDPCVMHHRKGRNGHHADEKV